MRWCEQGGGGGERRRATKAAATAVCGGGVRLFSVTSDSTLRGELKRYMSKICGEGGKKIRSDLKNCNESWSIGRGRLARETLAIMAQTMVMLVWGVG